MFELYKESVLPINAEIPEELRPLLKYKSGENLLLYAYLLVSRSKDNPIKDLRESERKTMAFSIAFKSAKSFNDLYTEKEKSEINKVIKEYKRSQSTGIQRDLDLYDKKIYQFIDLLNSMEPEIIKNEHEISGRITFSTNIDIINLVLENSIEIILDKLALQELKTTGKTTDRLRGSLSNKNRNKLLRHDTAKKTN